MTGPEHYRRTEELAAQAHRLPGRRETARPLRGLGCRGRDPAVLALAAAAAVGRIRCG